MSEGGFKNLTRRTTSDKILPHKAFNITKNLKFDANQRVLASVVLINFLMQIKRYLLQ